MRKWLKRRRAWLVLPACLAAVVACGAGSAAFTVLGEVPPDAEPALREAAALFAGARVSDRADQSYASAIAGIGRLLEGPVSDETRLRGHYYLAFSHYMNKDYDRAYAEAKTLLALALKRHPGHPVVTGAETLADAVRDGDVAGLDDVAISLAAREWTESARVAEELRQAPALEGSR